MIRYLLIACGGISLLLGIIGIFLPLLPTTPFVLLSAACWAKASPRFHRWLHRHRYFGPMVHNWEQKRRSAAQSQDFRHQHDDRILPDDVLAVSPTLVGRGGFIGFLFPCRHMDVAQTRILNAV